MKKDNHKYLLSLYSKVNQFLASNQNDQEELPDVVVSFCIVVEKILKIKLHKKNPLLVFDVSRMKDDDSLSSAVLKKEENIETIRIQNVIRRFEIVFKEVFSSGELQALKDVYGMRNHFVHGYKSDSKIDFDREDIIKKMGTIWDKIPQLAIALFGKDSIKRSIPKKKYTEEELEAVLIEEVKKKVGANKNIYSSRVYDFGIRDHDPESVLAWSFDSVGGKCPRCGFYGFALESSQPDFEPYAPVASASRFGVSPSDLYKCKKCHLELTRKEYEIARSLNT